MRNGARLRRAKVSKRALHILVVDDNEMAANGLSHLLKLGGHTTTLAYNGTEAIKKAVSHAPEVIILDIGLPDINGYEVGRLLRKKKNFSGTLIALTGYGQAGDKEKALRIGFNYHLTKPASLKELEAILQKVPLHEENRPPFID